MGAGAIDTIDRNAGSKYRVNIGRVNIARRGFRDSGKQALGVPLQ
jgi:hypothetical protein